MPALSAIRGRAGFTVSSIIARLCIRIANDPELPLGGAQRSQSAPGHSCPDHAGQLAHGSSGSISLFAAAAPSPETLRGAVFGRLLAEARLPDEWNGKPYPRARKPPRT